MPAIDLMLIDDQEAVELETTLSSGIDLIKFTADPAAEQTADDTADATEAVAVDKTQVDATLDDTTDGIELRTFDLPSSSGMVPEDNLNPLAYDFIAANVAGGPVAIDTPAPDVVPGPAVDVPAAIGIPAPQVPAADAPDDPAGSDDHEGYDHFFGGNSMMSMKIVQIGDLAVDADLTLTDDVMDWVSVDTELDSAELLIPAIDWVVDIADDKADQPDANSDEFISDYGDEGSEFTVGKPLALQDDMLM